MDQELRRLFHELADASPEDRNRILAERQVAPNLRAEVESLLSVDSLRNEALTECVAGAAAELLGSADESRNNCGPYRLVRRLGSGGMGSVWLAERTDGEIQQQVAVKLLGFGAQRAEWRARFLKERQILASLNHRSIVHVIDAGHTADGQPYLGMEYVEGAAIDAYATPLSLRDRLELFLRVCEGVSYAHRHLIIHRDLKPSNILVDASGQPKLLDFGIARLLDETGNATQTMERLLTLNYASPEQFRGAEQTTATDVYSLGAVLYKLLTGRSPHEPDTDKACAAEILAGTKAIGKPSRLNSSLPADLDYISLKALRIEPEERYVSVDAFANDIRAFLEYRPVEARSGNWYRIRKFVRRYRVVCAAAGLAFASLTIGLTLAVHERNLADRRFRDVRQIANELLNVEHDINALPGSTAARERIVKTSLRYLEGLSKDAGNDPALKSEIATEYRRVAEVQGVFGGTNLGRPADARASLQKAEALFRDVRTAKPADLQPLRNLIETVDMESRIDYGSKNFSLLAPRIAELESLFALYEPRAANTESDWAFLADTYNSMALSVGEMARLDQAAGFALRSIVYRRRVASQSKSIPARGNLSNSLATYGVLCRRSGSLEESLRAFSESIGLIEGILTDQPENYKARLNLANTLSRKARLLGDPDGPSLGRTDEAVEDFERSMRIGREVMASDPKETIARYNQAVSGLYLGNTLRDREPVGALAAYEEVIGLMRSAKDPTRNMPLIGALAGSTFALRRFHRVNEARQRLLEARQLAERYRHPLSPAGLECDELISWVEADWALASGHPLEAAAIHRAFLAEADSTKPSFLDPSNELSGAFTLTRHFHLLAEALAAGGQQLEAAQAEAKRREIVDLWKKKRPGDTLVEAVLSR